MWTLMRLGQMFQRIETANTHTHTIERYSMMPRSSRTRAPSNPLE